MGNRCHVAFPQARVAIYLHWNGGPESLVAFLDYMNERKLGCDAYGAARCCQIVGNFFGGNLSTGVLGMTPGRASFEALAGEDQGCYVIERGAEGLRIAHWYVRDKHLTGDALTERLERARAHPYNLDGAMLATIRDRNTATATEA